MIQVRWTANCIIRCRCQSGCECVVGMNKFTWERALTYERSALLFAWCQNMTITSDNIVWRGSCWPWYYTVIQHIFVFINIFFLSFRADLSTNRITHTLHFYCTCETLHDGALNKLHANSCCGCSVLINTFTMKTGRCGYRPNENYPASTMWLQISSTNAGQPLSTSLTNHQGRVFL